MMLPQQNTFNNFSCFRIISSAPAAKLMNVVHSIIVVIVILYLNLAVLCAEDEIHCLSRDDITTTTMDILKASGCSDDACIVSYVRIASDKSQHVNTNRDVHMHECLIFVDSLMDEIPSSIFSSLRNNISRLHVNNVGLKEIRRISILYGQNLERVSLARNSIRGIHETVFYDSSNLKELDLSENQLEKFATNAFEKLTSLETLNLSRNQIVNIPFDLFQNLNNLAHLNMRYNRLQIKFGMFPELVRTVDLSYNNIDIHFKFKIFSFLDELETLLLHGNRIENIHFSIFNLEKLKYLGISDNLFHCNMLADIFEMMKQKNVESVPERVVRDTSNIRGIKCIEWNENLTDFPSFHWNSRFVQRHLEKAQNSELSKLKSLLEIFPEKISWIYSQPRVDCAFTHGFVYMREIPSHFSEVFFFSQKQRVKKKFELLWVWLLALSHFAFLLKIFLIINI